MQCSIIALEDESIWSLLDIEGRESILDFNLDNILMELSIILLSPSLVDKHNDNFSTSLFYSANSLNLAINFFMT